MSGEAKTVFARFCLIGFGIPAVLLAFSAALFLSPWAIQRAEVSAATLNVAVACLAAAALAVWVFFSLFLYRRLWRVFPHVGDGEKGWSYAEGVFGLLGVGTSMASVLACLYYLLSGDLSRGGLLFALSFFLAACEALRFPARIAAVEDIMVEMG